MDPSAMSVARKIRKYRSLRNDPLTGDLTRLSAELLIEDPDIRLYFDIANKIRRYDSYRNVRRLGAFEKRDIQILLEDPAVRLHKMRQDKLLRAQKRILSIQRRPVVQETASRDGLFRTVTIKFAQESTDSIRPVFQRVKRQIKTKLVNIISLFRTSGLQMKFGAYNKYRKNDEIGYAYPIWVWKTISASNQIDSSLEDIITTLENRISEFSQGVSGLIYHSFVKFVMNITKAPRLAGSSYVELPAWITNKKATVNVKNTDQKCFLWSVLCGIHPVATNKFRVSNYRRYENELVLGNIPFPVELKHIPKFEKLNPTIGVNVLGVEGKKFVPLHASTNRNAPKSVNLILYNNHYIFVENMNRLFNNKTTFRHVYCPNCLLACRNNEEMNKHRENGCDNHKPRIDILPKAENAFVKFINLRKQTKLPYVIYADFECILQKSNKTLIKGTEQEHLPCGFKLIVVNDKSEEIHQRLYQGRNADVEFVKTLKEEGAFIMSEYKKNEKMVMTNADWKSFNSAKKCYLCNGAFNTAKCYLCNGAFNTAKKCYLCNGTFQILNKVRDHDHMTGQYRGALHPKCNVSLHNRFTKIPVYFHNGRKYDTHLFMKALSESFEKLEIIPKNSDNYVTITADKFQFLDTMSFLTASLESLVDTQLKSGADSFKISKKHYKENLEDFLRKGVYPYEYMDTFDRFNEPELPPIEAFYSSLRQKGIEAKDYEYAKKMFDKYCLSMRDYHNIYLEQDVYLLADVFENFRTISLKNYGLDPSWYITLPGLSWDSALKMSNKTIEVFNENQKDMLLMTEKGVRGGISCIIKRFAESTNDTIIKYYDANNLYGWAMNQHLPIGDYKWEESKDFSTEIIKNLPDDGARGYLFEVDLHVPDHLHDYLRDYPPAPLHIVVKDSMLSPYTKQMKETLNISEDTTKKLILSLEDKKNYVIHYRLLKQYISLGVEVTRVSRVISFKQEPWLKCYIDFNSTKRAQSKDNTEKDFFKLANNAIFGKTIENVRKRSAVKIYAGNKTIAPSPAWLNKWENHEIISDKLTFVEYQKTKDKINKPVIVGQAILDLSKLLMCQTFYMLKEKYPSMRLLMTDTDSFVLELPKRFNDDLLHDEEFKDLFDLSEFPESSPFFDAKNKKIVGKFKDEMAGKESNIMKFVGLKPKMYCFELDNAKDKNTAKGVDREHSKTLTFSVYKSILDTQKISKFASHSIRSRRHETFTIQMTKTCLSPFDNKFYQLDNINSVPYGHYLTRRSQVSN